jgi:hypothetical protein
MIVRWLRDNPFGTWTRWSSHRSSARGGCAAATWKSSGLGHGSRPLTRKCYLTASGVFVQASGSRGEEGYAGPRYHQSGPEHQASLLAATDAMSGSGCDGRRQTRDLGGWLLATYDTLTPSAQAGHAF